MTASLQCRLCRASLTFPESMAGKTTTCPHCGERLVVPLYGGPAPTSPPPAPTPGTRADLYPPGMGPPIVLPPRAPSLLAGGATAANPPSSADVPELPPAATPLPASPVPLPPPARSSSTPVPPAPAPLPPALTPLVPAPQALPPPLPPQAASMPPAPPLAAPPPTVPAAAPLRSVPPTPPAKLVKPSPVPPSGVGPPPPPSTLTPGSVVSAAPPPLRTSQTARFIAADPNAMRVPLGADGKLPSLLLEDVEQAVEEEAAKPKNSPPWLLLTVFGVSIAMSLALLFVDSEGGGGGERRSAVATRSQLQQHYAGVVPPLAPYQQKVRLALQAHEKGDREEEKRLYREVLDILHSESKNKSTGVTGMIDAPDPPIGNPSDRHLEGLISTLLSE
ncbi:MAG: hypothetical protein U0939_02005 [Pirellulales bacterium]